MASNSVDPSAGVMSIIRLLGSFNHVGNRPFRILASMFIERYSQADTRTARSAIVSEM
jgi:hypothetical protein